MQKCTSTDNRRTDTIHTSFSLTLSVVREHNSPSGKNAELSVDAAQYGEIEKIVLLLEKGPDIHANNVWKLVVELSNQW